MTITITVSSVAAIIMMICGAMSMVRAGVYMNRTGDYDFFSPVLGAMAGAIGFTELIVGLPIIFFHHQPSPGLTTVSVILMLAAIVHTVIGFLCVKDA